MALLPMAITPFGKFGQIANRFWYGTSAHIPPKLHTSQNKPNAIKAAKLSIDAKVPSGILQRARYGGSDTLVKCTAHHIKQWIQ